MSCFEFKFSPPREYIIVPRRSVSVDFVSNFFAVWDLNISSIFLFEAVVGN